MTDDFDDLVRANIDAFVASVAGRFGGLDVVEIGCGELSTNQNAFTDAKHYWRTDRAQLDIAATPCEHGICDVIVATEVLEHVPDTHNALLNCFALLRPGGTLVLTVPWEYPEHGDEDYWRFSDLGLDLILTRAGFGIVESGDAYVEERKTNLFRLARKP